MNSATRRSSKIRRFNCSQPKPNASVLFLVLLIFLVLKIGLFPDHGRSALGAFLVITGAPHLMGGFFTAVGANAISAGAGRRTASTALAAALTHTSARPRALASRACSISSRHIIHLLGSLVISENLIYFISQVPGPGLARSF